MLKGLTLLICVLWSTQGYSMQCGEILKGSVSIIERYPFAEGAEEEFAYLDTLIESRYNKTVFEYRVKKFGYKDLDNLKLTDEDIIRILIRFLNHRYTHVRDEALELGRGALLTKPMGKLSRRERLVLALIEARLPGARGRDFAISLLEKDNSPEALWYKAELLYKEKDFIGAKKALETIVDQVGSDSKIEDALSAVEHASAGKRYDNILRGSSFDETQWGPYETDSN